MLKKIISGGQTGADRAALDFAIKFNIEHGGWIPKGRITEQGPLPMKYQLVEMETTDYRERTKQNIIDSHGTVIISRGNLSGGSKLTQTYANVLGKPNCYIDLLKTDEFEAAMILKSFIMENKIRILNVAGPRLSYHPWIYKDVKTVLEVTLYLIFSDIDQDNGIYDCIPCGPVKESFPQTMEEAVVMFCDDLPLKTRIFIAKFDCQKIHMLYFTLLDYLRHKMGFDSGNQELLNDCCSKTEDDTCTIEDAVMEILKRFKKYLETDHILRVVK
ncbi:putative molybdenum carrier protein [Desulfobacula phenolica]|uniref:Putative molybdenum carrier n=1 Tax=Desulfobacula phenolica TaxID=90732 RepID=A0A1H2DPI9_9BACT|nr:putative molybdenum carrier protein [Desulfobacula phenolica]SDT84812.1 Putative molybdenum carrier [Desulfobacula phenolica]